MTAEERRVHRRDIQMIFQDPLAGAEPADDVGDIIAEPLLTHFPKTPEAEVRKRVGELMERVGLLRTSRTATRTSSRAGSASGSASRGR
jgi:oligopeptide transport system ATP-binding protein